MATPWVAIFFDSDVLPLNTSTSSSQNLRPRGSE